MSVFLPFFDRIEFFDHLISNPSLPLPDWETSRYYIDRFFSLVNSQLVFRLNLQIQFKSLVKLPVSKRFEGEPLDNFEFRRHQEFFAFYFFTAGKIPQARRKHLNSREQREIQSLHLERETQRLHFHLIIIDHILRSSAAVYGYEYQQRPFFLESVCSNPSNRNGKKEKKLELPTTKIMLELKKDRRRPTSTITDLPAPSNSLISSASVRESKKKTEIESTDEEDFDSYAKDILKMAPSAGIESSPQPSSFSTDFVTTDSQIYNNFFESITAFGDSESTFAAFPPPSNACDPDFNCLDAFEKKLERLIEERNQSEADQLNADTFDSMEDIDWEDEYDLMVERSQHVSEGRLFV